MNNVLITHHLELLSRRKQRDIRKCIPVTIKQKVLEISEWEEEAASNTHLMSLLP